MPHSFYGPAVGGFAAWAGVARPAADRLWEKVQGDLREVSVQGRSAWLVSDDLDALESPPEAEGVRLIPPGDPYLQRPNRSLLALEATLAKRLFRPVASPGAVLKNGRLAGLWRAKAKGKKAEISVEKLGHLTRNDLRDEVQRVAHLRGSPEHLLVVD